MLEKIVTESVKLGSVIFAGTCGIYVRSRGIDTHSFDALTYFSCAGYVPLIFYGVDTFLSSYTEGIKRAIHLRELKGDFSENISPLRVHSFHVAFKESCLPAVNGAGYGLIAYSLGYAGMRFVDGW